MGSCTEIGWIFNFSLKGDISFNNPFLLENNVFNILIIENNFFSAVFNLNFLIVTFLINIRKHLIAYKEPPKKCLKRSWTLWVTIWQKEMLINNKWEGMQFCNLTFHIHLGAVKFFYTVEDALLEFGCTVRTARWPLAR